jgi:diguanylate cyclase (GGDEF)-like protein
LDVNTLFWVNAIVMLVMAFGFLAAWARRRGEACWPAWIAANLVLASALVLYIFVPRIAPDWAVLPNALLVLGFGLRWRAARLFSASPTTWIAVWAPACFAALLFVPPLSLGAGTVFAAINLILATQAGVIAGQFWRAREPGSLSSYGLAAAYAIMAASFVSRVIEGLAFLDSFTTYLPLDGTLPSHLVVAVIHTSASGVFALSIAYERTTVQMRDERDSAQKRAQNYSRLAQRDDLTGLMNRRAIESRFSELVADGFCAMAVLDLDHFKRVNDRHGHALGDAALCATARALAPDDDCLAVRMGGEEFVLLLRGAHARERAESRRQAIPRRIAADVPGLHGIVTASMGLMELPRGLTGIAFSDLYSATDRLLYEAKNGGRNRLVSEKLSLFHEPPRRAGTVAA